MNDLDLRVAALKPAALDEARLAQPEAVLDARVAAIIRTPRERRRERVRHRIPIALTAVAAAVSVAAIAIPAMMTGDTHHSNPPRAGGSTGTVSARTFLLAGAQSVSAHPAAMGKYWHLKTRTCRPYTGAERPYRYTLCVSEDSWTSTTGFNRNIIGLDPKVTFATPRDQAEWRSEGSPSLLQHERLAYTENNNPMFAKWGLDGNRLSLGRLRGLPTDPAGLRKVFAKSYQGHPTATQLDSFIWTFAPELLAQPITPGTRAGIYRMLAQINGVRMIGNASDPEGRPAIVLAYADPEGGTSPQDEKRLAFLRGTYEFLSDDFGGKDSTTNVQLTAEWTNVLGRRQGAPGKD
jgi:hypothetical protein